MKLDELLRRQDVCFFCGYTIGIAGQTKCPECGKERPTAEEIGRVRRATRSGRAGVISLAAIMALLAMLVAYGYFRSGSDPLYMVVVWWYAATLIVTVAMMWPWFYLRRYVPEMLGRAWMRRTFMAAYPWLLVASVTTWSAMCATAR